MKNLSTIAVVFVTLVLATPLHAHRAAGLLQASLVEVLPTQIGVQVTLVAGLDIAPKIFALLDTDGDGELSEIESVIWSELFMARQSVTVDGKSVPLKLKDLRTSPLAELTNGHTEIVVHFTADLGRLACGPRTIVCANRYEPIPCAYQINGLVPKSPGVRITSHRRDEREKELTLAAEFAMPTALATQTAETTNHLPKHRPAMNIPLLIGLSMVGTTVATIVGRRRWPAREEP